MAFEYEWAHGVDSLIKDIIEIMNKEDNAEADVKQGKIK